MTGRSAVFAAILLSASSVAAAGDAFHVVDGDTFDLIADDGSRERIRIENIDAPELHSPSCPAERDLAILSAARLVALLASGDIEVLRSGTDRYGRTLAVVGAGGRDVGVVLIAEHLARPWRGRRETWCGPI